MIPPGQVAMPHLPREIVQEVYGMKLWGKVRYNKRRELWFVDGEWQGIRRNLYLIPTRSGFLSCKTEDLAVHLQMEISREIAQGTFQPDRYKKTRPLHMAKYAKSWLEDQKPNIKYKTWMGYRGIIDNYIIPYFGKEYLPYITHEKLKKFVNEQKKTGASTKSCKNRYALLYQILSDAKKSGYISEMPAPIEFSSEVKVIEWLTQEQQQAILAEIPIRHSYIFRFIFATGVRPGEARALRKKDLREDRIYIKKTMSEVKGGEAPTIVKNKREQAIPFYAEVRTLLEDMPHNLDQFVFVNPDTGRTYSKVALYHIWNPACQKVLGYKFPLKNAGRHSLANQILAAGGTYEDVRNALRHSTENVAREHYARPNLKVVGSKVDKMRSRK